MMTKEEIRKLIHKYEEGKTTLQEEQMLRDYFQQDNVSEELQEYADLFLHSNELRNAEAPEAFNPFEKIDFDEAETSSSDAKIIPFNPALRRTARIAAGFALLIIGFASGHYFNFGSAGSNTPVNSDIQKMQAALVNTFDHSQPTAGQRISAVNITEKLPANNKKLARQAAKILIYTMNNDDNVNVRLAAVEALLKYRMDVPVKPALIHSLTRQNDPLMQVTLIRMLVRLKAKGAIPAMQQLLASGNTGKLVRKHLQVGIAELKVRKPAS